MLEWSWVHYNAFFPFTDDKCQIDSTTPTADNQTSHASTLRARMPNVTLPWEVTVSAEERSRRQLVHTTLYTLGVLVLVAIGHAVLVSACYIRRRLRDDKDQDEFEKECYLKAVNGDDDKDCEETKVKMLSSSKDSSQNGLCQEPRYVSVPLLKCNEVALTPVWLLMIVSICFDCQEQVAWATCNSSFICYNSYNVVMRGKQDPGFKRITCYDWPAGLESWGASIMLMNYVHEVYANMGPSRRFSVGYTSLSKAIVQGRCGEM